MVKKIASSNKVLVGIRKPLRLYLGIPEHEKLVNKHTEEPTPKDTANYRTGCPELREVPYLCRE